MFPQAPLRDLVANLVVAHGLSVEHQNALRRSPRFAHRSPSIARLFSTLASDDEHKQTISAIDVELRKLQAQPLESASVIARRLGRILDGHVPYPADEQVRVLDVIASMRRDIMNGNVPPLAGNTLQVLGRMWRLADALGEPSDVTVASRKRKKRKAIDEMGMARALLAINQGTHTSTRAVADLLDVSQSSVVRHPVIKVALKRQGKAPRRGFRTRTREGHVDVEAIADEGFDSAEDSLPP